jgi:hypothetical protein
VGDLVERSTSRSARAVRPTLSVVPVEDDKLMLRTRNSRPPNAGRNARRVLERWCYRYRTCLALGRDDDFKGGKRWKVVAGVGDVVILDVNVISRISQRCGMVRRALLEGSTPRWRGWR